MNRFQKWGCISLATICVLVVAAFIFAIASPRPSVVEGTEPPVWLPAGSTEVFYRSQEGFGWWKVARFSISEADFRTYATKQGWTLSEKQEFQLTSMSPLLEPEEDELKRIPRALVYDQRAANGGGVTMVLDLSNNRGYYSASHR